MDAVFKTKDGIFNYRVAGILIAENHILLHKQVQDHHWALPGGRVQIQEDSISGLKREMKEELNFDCIVNNLLWVTENFFTYESQYFHEIGFYYYLTIEQKMVSTDPFLGKEGDSLLYQWILIDDLDKITIYPDFLKTSLKNLPSSTEHVIIRSGTS